MSFQQIAKYLLVALLFLPTIACTDWVKDDLQNCPTGCYIHFQVADELAKIGKNGTEGFAGEVNHITLLVFDENGLFVNSFAHTEKNFDMTVTLEPGIYQMLAWAGLNDTNYQLPTLSQGKTTMQEVVLTLQRNEDNQQNSYLTPLWHGKPVRTEVKPYEMNQVTIGMLKNNNTFVTILQDTSGKPLDGNTYSYEIIADNGRMGYDNKVLADEPIRYGAYLVETATVDAAADNRTDTETSLSVARSELNTLRLMKDRPARFVVTENTTGKKILDINLTQYLLLTREQYEGKIGYKLTDQEYLDYEDHFSIVFFLSPTGNVDNPYLCLSLKINGWIVRLNDNIVL